jgi:hypothetical protein
MAQQLLRSNIIQEWGLNDLSPEDQREAINRIGELLIKAIAARAYHYLTEDEKGDLEARLGGNESDLEGTLEYLEKKLPFYDVIVEEETEKLREAITA